MIDWVFLSLCLAPRESYPGYSVVLPEEDYKYLIDELCLTRTELAIELDLITKTEQLQPADARCRELLDERLNPTYIDAPKDN